MTTEYNFIRVCEQSGEQSSLFIGLSSGGWRFNFRAHPSLGLVSLQAWRDLFEKEPESRIEDEYHRVVSVADFLSFVEAKQFSATTLREKETASPFNPRATPHPGLSHMDDSMRWIDEEGYTFSNYDFS